MEEKRTLGCVKDEREEGLTRERLSEERGEESSPNFRVRKIQEDQGVNEDDEAEVVDFRNDDLVIVMVKEEIQAIVTVMDHDIKGNLSLSLNGEDVGSSLWVL